METAERGRTGLDLTGFSGDRRYVAYRWFTDPAARAVAPPEEQERRARQLVADLRAAVGRRTGDAMVAGLVDRLQDASTSAGSGPSTRRRSGAPTARPCCIRGSGAC
nr:hypothetical protein [Streptomyces sp. NA02950]